MATYYNEFDPYAAQWLRNLIDANRIPAGDVDERSITEVSPDDLRPYRQAHFFAGIGGWPLALRMAGWDDTRPVWTGSCPCQPFSAAGKQQGKADERHLWPVWFRLIAERQPSIIFGEQVASAIAHEWLDEAFYDLEAADYACGAAVLPACSVGAAHRRDRLWFVANSANRRGGALGQNLELSAQGTDRPSRDCKRSGEGVMANTSGEQVGIAGQPWQHRNVANADVEWQPQPEGVIGEEREWIGDRSQACGALGDALQSGLERHAGHEQGRPGWSGANGSVTAPDPFADLEWIDCPDGKTRPVKSGVRLLAHGVPARVGKLRAFGNAIDPRVAAEFIKAYDDVAA